MHPIANYFPIERIIQKEHELNITVCLGPVYLVWLSGSHEIISCEISNKNCLLSVIGGCI